MFSVTYEIITPESAEDGDAAESGYVAEGVSLREAIDLVTATDSCHCAQESIQCDEYPVTSPRWITVNNSADYLTVTAENRSLHIPGHITPASRVRIARLLGAYGA